MMLFNNIAFSLHFCSFFIKIISKSSLTTNRYGDLFFNDYPNKKANKRWKGPDKNIDENIEYIKKSFWLY